MVSSFEVERFGFSVEVTSVEDSRIVGAWDSIFGRRRAESNALNERSWQGVATRGRRSVGRIVGQSAVGWRSERRTPS
jgi:hypothetical protein